MVDCMRATPPPVGTPARRQPVSLLLVSKGRLVTTDFGRYLRRLMEAAGFDSDADFARATGIDGSMLSKWWSGTSRPTIESLRRIAPHLHVRLGDLMVAAGIATAEELGMVGEPPKPPDPGVRDPLLRSIGRSLADEQVPDDLRDKLRRGVQVAYDSWSDWIKTLNREHQAPGRGRPRR